MICICLCVFCSICAIQKFFMEWLDTQLLSGPCAFPHSPGEDTLAETLAPPAGKKERDTRWALGQFLATKFHEAARSHPYSNYFLKRSESITPGMSRPSRPSPGPGRLQTAEREAEQVARVRGESRRLRSLPSFRPKNTSHDERDIEGLHVT